MAIEDKFEDDIQKLMDQGKEKGYLTYGEVNDLLPDNMHSADDLDDLITTINTQGIDLLEGEPKFAGEKFDAEHAEEGDDVELDLTPGTLEKTNDPVRMYLREMGTVPLLTLEQRSVEHRQRRTRAAIADAERQGDLTGVTALITERMKLDRRLRELDGRLREILGQE